MFEQAKRPQVSPAAPPTQRREAEPPGAQWLAPGDVVSVTAVHGVRLGKDADLAVVAGTIPEGALVQVLEVRERGNKVRVGRAADGEVLEPRGWTLRRFLGRRAGVQHKAAEPEEGFGPVASSLHPDDPNREMLPPLLDRDYTEDPSYVDNITSAALNLFFGVLTLSHQDGTEVELDYEQVKAQFGAMASGSGHALVLFWRSGSTGKIMPTVFRKQENPNIAAAIEDIERQRAAGKTPGELIGENLEGLLVGAVPGKAPSLRRFPIAPRPSAWGQVQKNAGVILRTATQVRRQRSRALEKLMSHIQRGDPSFKGIKPSEAVARQLVEQILEKPDSVLRSELRNRIIVFRRNIGIMLRADTFEFDTFVDMAIGIKGL